jgi:hypothetical protein
MLKLMAVTAMFYELFTATTTPTVSTTAISTDGRRSSVTTTADVHPGG